MIFAVTIFVSAFLLFQIQPVVLKCVLPWYGGSPSVWTAGMLFFQGLLLAGYAYAHLIARIFHQKHQVAIHSIFLALSLLLLPVTPDGALKPIGTANPIWNLIQVLLYSVGAPFLMVSATGPLLQHWYSKIKLDKSPYRLYAVSNAGSLLGLLTYPFIFEPLLTLTTQTVTWSVVYAGFSAFCIGSGCLMLKETFKRADVPRPGKVQSLQLTHGSQVFLWVSFEATAVVLLLATTSYVCQDIAVIPFLWILPLSLYLLSFIITFHSLRWYMRWFWIPLLFISVAFVFYLLHTETTDEYFVGWVIALFSATLFAAVMVCHGELYRIKPPAQNLTVFYLAISAGGAFGGVFVNFIAPSLFIGWWEFPTGFISLSVLLCVVIRKEAPIKLRPKIKFAITLIFLIATAVMIKATLDIVGKYSENVLVAKRNFYGILRVYEGETDHLATKKLYHGRINHGMQFQSRKWRTYPTTYFAPWSGVGVALRKHPKKHAELEEGYSGPQHNIKVGIIGLGAGTLCTYSRSGDVFRFYEINPAVIELATRQFTYLADARGDIQIVTGDGRLSLERELKETGSHQFDVMVIDAFSGDAIPIHLLTLEAMKLYFCHLAADGILAIHISNRHLSLQPVIEGIAKTLGKSYYLIKNGKRKDYGIKSSTWVLLTDNKRFINHAGVMKYIDPWPRKGPPQVWTDDYSNLLHILK